MLQGRAGIDILLGGSGKEDYPFLDMARFAQAAYDDAEGNDEKLEQLTTEKEKDSYGDGTSWKTIFT